MTLQRILRRAWFGIPLVLILLWLAAANVWNRWVPPSWKYRQAERAAKNLAEKVEQFRDETRRLPTPTEVNGDLRFDSIFAGDVHLLYLPAPDAGTYVISLYSAGDDRSYDLDPATGRWSF